MSNYTPVHLAIAGKPFHSLLRYNLRYWRAYAIGAALALVFTLLSLTIPWAVRAIVAGFENGTMTLAWLITVFAVMLAAAIFGGIARYYQRTLMIGSSRRFEYDLRNDFFAHIQRMSRRFFNKTPTGDIIARATNDLNYVREFIGPGIMGSVDMVRIPFTLAMMIWLSPKLTLLTLIPLPFITILAFIFIRFLNRQSKKVQEIFSQVSSRVQENLAGSRVVKAHAIEDRESRAFAAQCQKYLHANIRLVLIMSIAIPLLGILVGAIILILVWQGGSMVIRGEIQLGDLTAFLICLIMLAFPLAQLGYVMTLYQRGSVGMTRIAAMLAEEPEIWDRDSDAEARINGGAIALEHVGFAYRDVPVLEDVSLSLPAGSSLAIVGPTGSGKSTLVSLLVRDYDPVSGTVRVDGHDLRRIPLAVLRDAIGYVPQDGFVFSDSIRNNLLLAKPDASEAELLHACDLAQFSEALRAMPHGLDTLLGERGINLSGGQKQRLALARALLRQPRILILDDALSAVDTHTEEQILHGLRNVMRQRTSILISHRISTVRDADHIIVLDNGRITESGRHDELAAADGLYAAMYRRQLLETALEDSA